MSRSDRVVFVDVAVRVIFRAVVIGSIYLLAAGHNQPGGGFVGGLVAGAAISLRYLAGGIDDVRSTSRFRPWTILGTGLLFSAVAAGIPLVIGRPLLDSMGTTVSAPLLGEAWVSTTLLFDAGVYVLVVGLVFMVFEAFGDDTDTDTDPSAQENHGAPA
jgi:multicomponent Na+:H+ antiporter subunit A